MSRSRFVSITDSFTQFSASSVVSLPVGRVLSCGSTTPPQTCFWVPSGNLTMQNPTIFPHKIECRRASPTDKWTVIILSKAFAHNLFWAPSTPSIGSIANRLHTVCYWMLSVSTRYCIMLTVTCIVSSACHSQYVHCFCLTCNILPYKWQLKSV